MSDIFERLSRILRAELNRFKSDFFETDDSDAVFREAMEELDDFLAGRTYRTERQKNSTFHKPSIDPEIQKAFDVLGLSYDSSFPMVKKAYREAMRRFHPDRIQGDEEALKKATEEAKKINHAYSVLKDFFTAKGL
ncbi:J domain-containing protein [Spirochaetia bacterium 38H-sp]|uniref:J domain-containing protein n=1 Tax=Rarispira pelagica TaxID=3141764 RepID=A0ABU9UDT9_9SPIR